MAHLDKIKYGVVSLILILFLSSSKQVNATHIVGGELNYTYLGSNNYRIDFDYFIDCLNGNNSAITGDITGSNFVIFDGNTNTRLSQYDRSLASGAPKRVSEVNYQCIITKPNACVDRYQFSFTLNLPPRNGGYVIAFQRCCRNNSITNLANPGSTGSTYWTKIEDLQTQNWTNNSASFRTLPPNFLCTNAPLTFDHSATDVDGDSLAYELYRPFNSFLGTTGAYQNNPKPGHRDFLAPPFTQVTYAAGYSVLNQIDASNTAILDPVTGLLSFTPTQAGQFVVGILVKEYRNGTLVGTTRRDYQFNVSNCVFEVVSSFFAPTKTCDFSINFNNNSQGTGLTYKWDFGETTDATDQSTLPFPSYTYKNSGTYEINLIAQTQTCADTYKRLVRIVDPVYPNLGPDDTVCSPFSKLLDANINTTAILWSTGEISRTITVNKGGEYIATYMKEGCSYKDSVYIEEDADFPEMPNDTIFCNNEPFIHGIRTGTQYNSYLWNTGETTPNISTSNPGVYRVTVLTQLGCTFTDSMEISQQLPPEVSISDTLVCPGYPGEFDAGDADLDFLWSTGETSNVISPSSIGIYTVQVFDGKCYNKDSATLSIVDVGPYGLPLDTTFCDQVNMFLNPGSQFIKYEWSTGESTKTIIALERGKYTISLTSKEGCIVSDSINIGLNPLPNVSLGPDTTVCEAINLELDAGNGVLYSWNDGSDERVNIAYYEGLYIVQVTDENGCINGDTIEIQKDPFALPSELYMPNAFTPNGDGINDVYPDNQFQDIGVEYNLKIFTRWGEKLEDFDNTNSSWDGNYKGAAMAEGVYIYLIDWVGCDNVRRQKKGNVTLLK